MWETLEETPWWKMNGGCNNVPIADEGGEWTEWDWPKKRNGSSRRTGALREDTNTIQRITAILVFRSQMTDN
jgi:hypothetical protein